MIELDDLRKVVKQGLDYIKSQSDIQDVEVFVSWYDNITVRLNYTSDIPCSGVQEPKNILGYGVGVFASFKTTEGLKTGYGSETADISLDGVKNALSKARVNAVLDPDYKSLPDTSSDTKDIQTADINFDNEVSEEHIISLGWKTLESAIKEFQKMNYSKSLIVGGDINILLEKMAVGNTNGLFASDTSQFISSAVTSMIENENAKGTGWNVGNSINDFDPTIAGSMAAKSAINSIGGKRIESGKYKVIFGPQAVAMLFSEMIISALSLNSIDKGNSPYGKKIGQIVANKNLNIYDDGSMKEGPASKRFTCEGVLTGRTDLIEKGRLVGFLTNNYYAKKLQSNIIEFPARNGFKFGRGGGRDYKRQNSIYATNFVIEGNRETDSAELLSKVKNGIYIGRLWYLYPVYGLAKADFTGTVIGDSYIIENGKIISALKPNSVRITDNFVKLLNDVIGISKEKKPTQLWDAEEVIHAPEIAVKGIRLNSIADI
ncbi:MAG TPA: TldD/PmbA family protein [Thermodesulfobacteriota bacterium]|nr:TldD/PmbA family protein [Thermodesulfobacteriota bacterium]